MGKRLSLGFEHEHDYTLLGMHTTLEDYHLAYFLNKSLHIKLKKSYKDLDFKSDKKGVFSIFDFENKNTFISWHLISNKYKYNQKLVSKTPSLFNNTIISQVYTSLLINELPTIDYFIKINGEIELNLPTIITKINSIDQVITTYSINANKLKSKDYLIF